MEFLERRDHYLEIKDDDTVVKHHTVFGNVRGNQIRVDIDPVTKIETPTFIKVKNVIEIEKATGKIRSIKRNFDPKREILGAEAHDDPLLENVIVEAIDYPTDMQSETDGSIKYDYDKATKKLKRKT